MSKETHQLGSPDDTSLREYIITLHDHNDSGGFYEDMETEGGNITIPNRACECCNRRPISRNTHYHLTYEEARQVLEDDRVKAVSLTPAELGLKPVPLAWQTSSANFDKVVASNSDDINWGFVTSSSKTKLTGWGTGATLSLTKNVVSELSGKNVDIVIADDGTPFPSTLEFQQNPDGTGYTRLVQYNWFKHTNELGLGNNSVYDYSLEATTNSPRLQEHGAHTMGTSGGNTQGWARDANLYFISFYDDNMTDYVRAFHNNKPINPVTGVRNPTVMNNSWGYNAGVTFTTADVSEIRYQGTIYTPTSGTAGNYVWDQTLIDNFWCNKNLTRIAAVDADFEDMIADGIIVVASAGNDNSYMDVPGGPDYDNYFIKNANTYYPHRGSTPGAAPGVICVGAAGSHNEAVGASIYTATSIEDNYYRAEFSNFGPRVDIWAAGAGIQSIWNSNDSLYDNIAAADPRLTTLGLSDTVNNNFKKCPGTSMSGPQVCGLMACLAEAFPRLTQEDARSFLETQAIQTMDWTLGGRTDPNDLGVSKNADSGINYAGQYFHRYSDPSNSVAASIPYPDPGSPGRPSSGITFPRSSKLFSRNTTPTYALSVNNSTVVADGTNNTTVTLTTTGVPNGTKIPYIITSKYKGTGKTTTSITDNGVYNASNSGNNFVTTITGSQFGDGNGTGTVGTEKRHKINMSIAATNPTWIDDPSGFSYYDYESAIDPNIPSAGSVTVTVTASGTSAYVFNGSDRVKTHSSANNATIIVNYGDTLNFTINSGATHPFYVKYTTANGGTSNQVTAGVTNQGATSGTVTINTTQLVDSSGNLLNSQYGDDAAEIILYYQCSNHSSMRGMIIVRSRVYPTFFNNTVEVGYFTGSTDDGYWKFPIPWNVPIFGSNKTDVYLSTNSFITFGSGSVAYQNLDTIAFDKILLGAGDGSSNFPANYIGGTAPNRFMFVEYFGYTSTQLSGDSTWWQMWFYENDPNNIYISVVMNGRYSSTVLNDRYPFYQNEVLGALDTTGEFTVNNNTATLTITPDSEFTQPSDQPLNVNLRLGFYGSPSVDFTVTS